MKYTNEPSARTAMAYGCKQVDEFADEVNEITRVFAISREEARSYAGNREDAGFRDGCKGEIACTPFPVKPALQQNQSPEREA